MRSHPVWADDLKPGKALERVAPGLLLWLMYLVAWGCGPVDTVVVGDLHIEGTRDVRRARHYTRVTGSIRVRDTSLREIALPALEKVDNSLSVLENRALEELALPALEEVGGSLTVAINSSLQELRLPSLRRVGHEMWFDGAPAVVRLESLEEALSIHLDGRGPIAIHLPQLRAISYLEFSNYGQQIEFLDISALEEAKLVVLERVNKLRRFDAPSLGSGPEESWVDLFRIGYAEDLREINVDQLRLVGGLEIVANPQLESLSMASIESIARLEVIDNPQLPHCHAKRLVEHVMGANPLANVEIRGNNDPCEPNPCDGACIVDCSVEEHYRCAGDDP